MNTANYKTSKDYARLWELAKTARIICITDYRADLNSPASRDVAETVYSSADGESVVICARGTVYAFGLSREDFIRQCQLVNVEFIDPCDWSQPAVDLTIQHATRIVKEAIMLMAEAIDDCAGPRNKNGCWDCPRHQDGSCAERQAIDKLIPGYGNTACFLDRGGFTEFVSGLIEGWTVEGLGRAFLKSQIERDIFLLALQQPPKEQPPKEQP